MSTDIFSANNTDRFALFKLAIGSAMFVIKLELYKQHSINKRKKKNAE